MPMKIPKGFARRKSAGNILDEFDASSQQASQEGTFRVFARPDPERAQTESSRPTGKSLDGGSKLNFWANSKGPKKDKIDPFLEQKAAINRGSGGSNTNSASTSGYNDTSSSSARLSSSSTVPSSTEDLENPRAAQQPFHNIPVPPAPKDEPVFSLKAGNRTFSFGTKTQKPNVPSHLRQSNDEHQSYEQPPPQHHARDRGMTESSYASTAIAPQLDTTIGTPEGLGTSFGDMFGNIGKRQSAVLREQEDRRHLTESPDSYSRSSSALPSQPPGQATQTKGASFLTPLSIDRTREVEQPPRSWGSTGSGDVLMTSSPINATRGSQIGGYTGASSGYRRTGWNAPKGSASMEDEDAKLVMESVAASRALNRSSGTASSSPRLGGGRSSPLARNQTPVGLFDSEDPELSGTSAWRADSNSTTPRLQASKPVSGFGSPTDALFKRSPQLSSQQEDAQQGRDGTKKVMTPAQFEKYRRESEMIRSKSDVSKGDDSDGEDNYEDEDDTERIRQMAKQRRKQEAHLAVYRQQMMKVTGENTPLAASGGRPHGQTERASTSTPNLLGGSLSPGLDERRMDAGKQSDDEDDDVPLAILQAHGFPSKTRAPSQAGGPAPSIRSVSQLGSYPPPPASVAGGESGAGAQRHSQLPVFARGLPQDPYGLVAPSNRQSLGLGQNRPASAMAGGIPAGGLVGVIAGEERARAMRRGSPNANGNYDSPPMQNNDFQPQGPQQSAMAPGGMMQPQPPYMDPNAPQSAAQMSAQMQQMMQMQMHFMQQMQLQMASLQPGQQIPPQLQQSLPQAPNFPPNGDFHSSNRPVSVHSHSYGPPPPHHRAMSMIDSSYNPQHLSQMAPPQPPYQKSYASSVHSLGYSGQQQGYAPSIAPSERSNVGMPARYRPVSNVPAVAVQAPSSVAGMSSPRASMSGLTNPLINGATRRRVSSGPAADEDEDDEEAWAELKKKKEKKRGLWRRKKEPAPTEGLGDLNLPDYY